MKRETEVCGPHTPPAVEFQSNQVCHSCSPKPSRFMESWLLLDNSGIYREIGARHVTTSVMPQHGQGTQQERVI